jgi:hypothetical protein
MSHGYLVQEGRSTTIQASRCLLSFPSSAQVLLHGTILPGRGRDAKQRVSLSYSLEQLSRGEPKDPKTKDNFPFLLNAGLSLLGGEGCAMMTT